MGMRVWGTQTLVKNATGVPVMATLTDGSFIVVSTLYVDGQESVVGQRYNADGTIRGAQLTLASGGQGTTQPSLTATADGGFTIGYTKRLSTTDSDPFVARFDKNGTLLTAIDADGSVDLGRGTSVASLYNGNYVISYVDPEGSSSSIDVRIYNASNVSVANLQAINASDAGETYFTDTLALPNGKFVVAWGNEADHSYRFRLFNSDGTAQTADTYIALKEDVFASPVNMTALSNGGFVITYEVPRGDSYMPSGGTRAKLYNANGNYVGTVLDVANSDNSVDSTKVVGLAHGGFAAFWLGAGFAIHGQLYSNSGDVIGRDFIVNTSSLDGFTGFTVEATELSDGRIAVGWSGNGPDMPQGQYFQIIDPRDGVVPGTRGNDTLYGNDFVNDDISALDGNDVLHGMGGDDRLWGDVGTDTLYGEAGNDTLYGGADADRLNGGTGVDTMIGGAGSDVYYVDNAADIITEGKVGDVDTVVTYVSYVLKAGVEVEKLITNSSSGTSVINLTGNEFSQQIAGNAAANVLSGLAGNDKLYGYNGSDTLYGGLGTDTLSGGLGNDYFVFNSAPTANIDTIVDFHNITGDNDTIRLENAVFTKLTTTAAFANNFVANASGTAVDGNDYIIYETDTGKLFYDSNGSTAGGSVQIALISGHPTLTLSDFVVI